MRPVTMFEADDGKRFESEEACILYERQQKFSEEIRSRIKVWDDDFNPLEPSVKNFNWTEIGQYFYAPDSECREALNFAFDDISYVPPFVGLTEKSVRVKWDEDAHEFIDFDEFCEEMEKRRRAMN